MEPTTIHQLLETGSVTALHCGIAIRTRPTWIVQGETHLSYTTLTRLVECCREYHWQTDIVPHLSSTTPDAICKSISAEFLRPVPVSATIIINYEVKQIRSKGYELHFKILSGDRQTIYAVFDIVFVFCDIETNQGAIPPKSVLHKLTELSNQATLKQSENAHE